MGMPAPKAGLYLMNTLLDPDRYLARLTELGAEVVEHASSAPQGSHDLNFPERNITGL